MESKYYKALKAIEAVCELSIETGEPIDAKLVLANAKFGLEPVEDKNVSVEEDEIRKAAKEKRNIVAESIRTMLGKPSEQFLSGIESGFFHGVRWLESQLIQSDKGENLKK